MDYCETGKNCCLNLSLSEFKQKKDKISFPSYYLEDYFIDIFDDWEINYDEKIENQNKLIYINKDDINLETLRKIRTEAYSAINWYEHIKEYTIPSYFIKIESNLRNAVNEIKTFPVFVKLDNVSAKDTNHNGVFNSKEEILETFNSSNRIKNTLSESLISREHYYLFVRDVIKLDGIECRCFIRHSKLTAISISTEIKEPLIIKEHITKYIKKIIPLLPYADCIIDILYRTKNDCIVIEINNFGADSIAGSGEYCWIEDYLILYGYNEPTEMNEPKEVNENVSIRTLKN
jgi:hypothetical protein